MTTPLEHAVLKRVYPWDPINLEVIEYDLWQWAQRSGYEGTLAEFKTRYGQSIKNLETYDGPFVVAALEGETQQLQTQGKFVPYNITIQPLPIEHYTGQYEVVPMAELDQILRTNGKQMDEDVIIEKIPYYETSNDAGGYTVIIG